MTPGYASITVLHLEITENSMKGKICIIHKLSYNTMLTVAMVIIGSYVNLWNPNVAAGTNVNMIP